MILETMPIWFTNLVTVVFGLIIGSFLNVVIYRLPLEKSLVRPGSSCPACEAPIRWWDNIPVLSYFLLRGRCRSCKAGISARYPAIEVLTAVLFFAVRLRFGWSPLLFLRDWPFVSILVAVTFIDLDHRIIPDPLSLGGLLLGLITSAFVPEMGWLKAAIGAGFGFGVFYAMAWIYERLSGRPGLGGGDVKLLAMLGAFLGPGGVFAAILISSVFGSVVGIGWALVSGKGDVMKVAIPYGPFLVVGGLYYYLLGDVLWFQFMIPM